MNKIKGIIVTTIVIIFLIASAYHLVKKKELEKETTEVNLLLKKGNYEFAVKKIKEYGLSDSEHFEVYIKHPDLLTYYKEGNNIMFASKYNQSNIESTDYLDSLFNKSITKILKNKEDSETYIYGFFNPQIDNNKIMLLNDENYKKVTALIDNRSLEKLIDEVHDASYERVLEIANELKDYNGNRRQELDDSIAISQWSRAREAFLADNYDMVYGLAKELRMYNGQYRKMIEKDIEDWLKYSLHAKQTKENAPSLGMTEDEINNSSWGRPNKKNTTTTSSGKSEQWVYSGDRYIYLDNGIVTAIQE